MNTKELIEHCKLSIKVCYEQGNLTNDPDRKQRWKELREAWELSLFEAENPERIKFFRDINEMLKKHERPVKKYPDGIGILTADFNHLISEIFKYVKETNDLKIKYDK